MALRDGQRAVRAAGEPSIRHRASTAPWCAWSRSSQPPVVDAEAPEPNSCRWRSASAASCCATPWASGWSCETQFSGRFDLSSGGPKKCPSAEYVSPGPSRRRHEKSPSTTGFLVRGTHPVAPQRSGGFAESSGIRPPVEGADSCRRRGSGGRQSVDQLVGRHLNGLLVRIACGLRSMIRKPDRHADPRSAASFARSAWLGVLQTGYRERIEAPERYLPGRPSSRRRHGRCRAVARGLPCRTWLFAGICSRTIDEAGLRARFCEPGDRSCSRTAHRSSCRSAAESVNCCGDQVKHVLLGLGVAQIGVQEMLPRRMIGRLLQIIHADKRESTARCWVARYEVDKCPSPRVSPWLSSSFLLGAVGHRSQFSSDRSLARFA